MTLEKPPYRYNYTRLDTFLANDYDPTEAADRLREARLVIAEQMGKEEFDSEWKLLCYRMLYDLEEIFRKLQNTPQP